MSFIRYRQLRSGADFVTENPKLVSGWWSGESWYLLSASLADLEFFWAEIKTFPPCMYTFQHGQRAVEGTPLFKYTVRTVYMYTVRCKMCMHTVHNYTILLMCTVHSTVQYSTAQYSCTVQCSCTVHVHVYNVHYFYSTLYMYMYCTCTCTYSTCTFVQ